MNKSQKVLIAITILLVAFGTFIIYNQNKLADIVNSKINNVSKSLVGAQNSDWQIYKNQQYGYTIKYPKGFYVDARNSEKKSPKGSSNTGMDYLGGDTTITNYPNTTINSAVIPSDYVGIRYDFYEVDKSLTLNEYLDYTAAKLDGLQKFDLNGTPAAVYLVYSETKDGNHERQVTPTVISIKNGKMFVAIYTYYEGTKNLIEVADEIVKSFTFTQ